jgi:hypothetical protein
MVMATRGYSTTLDKLDAPLNTMAQLAHVPLTCRCRCRWAR